MAFGRMPPVSSIDVLIVDKDPGQRRALADAIASRAGGRFQPCPCDSPAAAVAAAHERRGAMLLADLETIGGPARLPEIVRSVSPIIATSTDGSLTVAVAAVRAGAVDFLPKPIGARALIERLEAAVAAWTPLALKVAAASGRARGDFAGFIGRSQAMLDTYEQIRRVARSRAPVFITGESGTGKELCAEAIHAASGNTTGPFVAINCSAIPRELMESEIFGHVRGAFTGAVADRAGAAELADGGTLFLDEIGELDLSLQAKLLRFVQSGSLKRVGGNAIRRVSVRLVSATNRDPFAEVEAGHFRADLFYRLHVLPIRLPPLRLRRDDITHLASAFLASYAAEEGRSFVGFSAAAATHIRAYGWPGNVRELQNVIRRIVVLYDGEEVTPDMLPPLVEAATPMPGESGEEAVVPFWQAERAIIEAAVARFGSNIARAAAALEISPSTIYRKRQAWSALEAERRRTA